MRLLCSVTAYIGFALLVCSSPLEGQTPAQTPRGHQAYVQAVTLHVDQKIPQAFTKIKEALAADPKNRIYLRYRAELETLLLYNEVDQHALHAPAAAEKTPESLAAYLAKGASTDRDKARVIYRWITDRISYDVEGLMTGKRDSRVEAVLQNRKCVCEGYARLYERLCKEAGVECQTVHGRTKEAAPPPPGKEASATDHAWNVVKIDDKWYLIDATWGAGSLNNGKYKKRFQEYFFLSPPEEFAYTHFPVDSNWQLLASPMPLDDFKRGPRIPSQMFQLGFSAHDIGAKLAEKDFTEFVSVYNPIGPKITVRTAPLDKNLRNGSKYKIRIETAAFEEMMVSMPGGKPIVVPLKGDGFEMEFVARKGDMTVSGRLLGAKQYDGVLRYKVN